MSLEVMPKDKVIALSGNPNVGKSTVFNSLTGLNQHTGNWPGKTVANAKGNFSHNNKSFILVDLPGTYSLLANSVEEEVARDFICFGKHDAIVVVVDATCLERNLNLVMQILEVTNRVIICVNLLDEAKKKKIRIDLIKLQDLLGVPVVGTSARSQKGLNHLLDKIYEVSYDFKQFHPCRVKYDDVIEQAIAMLEPVIDGVYDNKQPARYLSIRLLDGDTSFSYIKEYSCIKNQLDKATALLRSHGITSQIYKDKIASAIVIQAEKIYKSSVTLENISYNSFDRRLDKILTSKLTGIPIMVLLLGVIFWITITGANYPSEVLSAFLFWIENKLLIFFDYINAPLWLKGVTVSGMYRTLAWVVSVMLPPMAIFFPLFTLLEDFGYLPRIAFNMDNYFKSASAHGKQSLTMCMGFGCNACGVIGCRIIDSPRERLIAILTNNFVPCNGRFPLLISVITMFFVKISPFRSVISTLILTGFILLSIIMTLIVSKLLSKTILKGVPSTFALELPPYRCPQFGKVIIRSVFDRTLFVLKRAVIVAIPSGIIIWLMANIKILDISILKYCSDFLGPFATLIGLDGIILMAFILGFPANEIVIPIVIMSYLCTGNITEFDSLEKLKTLLINNGWTWLTAICTMILSLFHFPCATTCWTIKKETGSLKWTLISIFLPTAIGIILCFAITTIARFFNMV